jgi:hypothetical protein
LLSNTRGATLGRIVCTKPRFDFAARPPLIDVRLWTPPRTAGSDGKEKRKTADGGTQGQCNDFVIGLRKKKGCELVTTR